MRLSTGTYYKNVPKKLDDNYRFRRVLLEECRKSAGVRAQFLDRCRKDILYFVNAFCWTFRPKAKGGEDRVVPFVTWDGQDELFLSLVDHIDRQVPLVVEKSRDAGASWACIYVDDWGWRFHRYMTTGLSSRVADLVDSKSPDSLFWKLRFVQKWLPGWMWPGGWTPRVHDTEMHYENPQTGSITTGHPTTKDIGIAGRTSWFMFDEFSRVPNAKSVLDNTKDTSDCRVFVSTHTGPGTEFHKLCINGVTDKIVLHWSQHPEKKRGLYRYRPDWQYPTDIEVLDKGFQYKPLCPTCWGMVDVAVGEPAPCHPEADAIPWEFNRSGKPSGGPHKRVRSPWYDKECRGRSEQDVKTNLDCDVAGAMSQFFDPILLDRLIEEHCREPEWVGDVRIDAEGHAKLESMDGGPLRLWITPDMRGEFRRSRYVIGIDVSAGTGATPSCAGLADAFRRMKVAEYTNAHIPPERFAVVMAALGHLFRDAAGQPAKVGFDASGAVGSAFRKTFMGQGYPNVRYHRSRMGYGGEMIETDKPGYYLNSNEIKGELLLSYRDGLDRRAIVNPSKDSLEELRQFQWIEGRVVHAKEKNADDPSAARESHADQGIADAILYDLFDDKSRHDGTPPATPEPDPPPGSWAWRMKMAEQADLDAENGEGWQE
jgi:hypothetical protein